MTIKSIRYWLLGFCITLGTLAFSQSQTCPVNFNFGMGTLTDWSAYTGNNKNGNGAGAIKVNYSATNPAPAGTNGATSIPEYNLPSVAGIKVNTTANNDLFGGFTSIPTINGYAYNYSITLGSTSITQAQNSVPSGGFIRGVTYVINVPTSPIIQPYTITYAYAMVLENGSHPSGNQPVFNATLTAGGSVIQCASPKYLLPTLGSGNAGGSGATLDTAAARQEGFTLSNVASPNSNGNKGETQFRVYTKDWSEVALDLSPYRGQQVTLSFETDNCVPGGHFSYAYIALRNSCAGLIINGDSVICANSNKTYSIPALSGATYNWTIPSGWSFVSGQNSNIINVTTTTQGGSIFAHEQNGCADLYDTLQIKVLSPGMGGNITGNATVCTGINTQTLLLSGNTGAVTKWIASTDNGITYTDIANVTNSDTVKNLTATTLYKAVSMPNTVCPLDTSTAAIITVNQKSVGGILSPNNLNICANQAVAGRFSLSGNAGAVVNWQSSQNGGIVWVDFVPKKTDSTYLVPGQSIPFQYRSIVQNGVCPADTSTIASTTIYAASYPQATFSPVDTTICYGSKAQLNVEITVGTNYTWANTEPLQDQGSGTITSLPTDITAIAAPSKTTDYVLNVQNAGCPNTLMDTFHVNVLPPIVVFAGNDTSIVIGQPLVFQSSASSFATKYLWTPSTGLDATNILQPTATITTAILGNAQVLTYVLTVSTPNGCQASNSINLRVFETLPSIFVPSAFTPNGDGVNDVLRPILAGIQRLDYFRIYNRFGQLLFETQGENQGWDGTINGKLQASAAFVYAAQAVDYTNRVIKQTGTFMLIR